MPSTPVPGAHLAGGQLPDVAEGFFDAAHLIAVSAPYLAAGVLLLALGAVAVAVRRAALVRSALAHRTRVETVPTSTFDPKEDEVARWGRHLERVRYAAGHIPARGAAARLHYTTDSSGQMRCYLEGPSEAEAVFRMPGFAEVEVRADRASRHISPVRFQDGR